jgi:release factor glutamine methyltransferase
MPRFSKMTEPIRWPTIVVDDVRSALKEGMARLRNAHVPSHTLAAEMLLMHALGRDRTWIYTHSEEPVAPGVLHQYFTLIARRAAGEPTQYLTGKQEFWDLEFEVTPAVLIPRPETEHVVEIALERLGYRGIKIDMATGEPSPKLRIADVGTGSGCIAVALAYELPHAEIVATDISAAALDVAKRNAARHAVSKRIEFLQCDVLDGAGPGPNFDLIVSNPPYVSREEAATLAREVRDHEPAAALFGGHSGLEIYEKLIEQAGGVLNSEGVLVVELGYSSSEHVLEIFHAEHHWKQIHITNDLAGIPRVAAAERA